MDIHLERVKLVLPNGQTLFKIPHLEIKSGSRILIHGPSGRGKTTLLHLLAGLFEPTEGEVKLGGISLARLSDSDRAKFRRKSIGIIFQRLNLLDHLTALENIALSGAEEQKCQDALHVLGMDHAVDIRAGVLSLGEQQRVAVSRVMAAKPELILADEPTSSLDQVNAEKVMEGLFLSSQGGTLIVVSHDDRIKSKFTQSLNFSQLVQ